MTKFSVGETAISGFALVARRPWAALAWGLVFLLILALPIWLLIAPVLFDIPEIVRLAQQNDVASTVTPPWVTHFVAAILLFFPLLAIGGLLAHAVVSGAVYRAVLEPKAKCFASLRLGKAELWLMLLHVAKSWVMGFAMAAILIGAGLVALIGVLLGGCFVQPWAGIIRAPFLIAAVVGAVGAGAWLGLRLSLAGPMTFAEKQFRLFESWTLTRGHVAPLFAMGALLLMVRYGLPVLIYSGVWLILVLGGVTLAGFVGPISHTSGGLATHSDLYSLLGAAAPILVLVGLVLFLAVGAFEAIFQAPWAVAYRELKRDAKPDHPPVF
jgi:hypothetical protein